VSFFFIIVIVCENLMRKEGKKKAKEKYSKTTNYTWFSNTWVTD